ncbi:MAG: class II histone deacetylase [Hyphomicrobiales bacterium]|uniref:class II histone deacetylase n=1 Tax=Alphaproteobacteria TaxID=28211 RepID=UPI0032671615
MQQNSTAWVSSELLFWHNTQNWCMYFEPNLLLQPGQHAESAESKRRIRNLVEASGIDEKMITIRPEPATREEAETFHTKEYLDKLKAVSNSGYGDAGELCPVGKASYEIALMSAGAAMTASRQVLCGNVSYAYALTRPPGHHAVADSAKGFCLLNNGVLAVKDSLRNPEVKKIAVVDWDVHHGNGTEEAFYSNGNVLTISVHQDALFPLHTGKLSDRGEGAGFGKNLNIPLPAGSGDGAYRYAFEQVVLPSLLRFSPDMVFVASGFDASAADPIGRMMLHSESYRWMTEELLSVCNDLHAKGPVFLHEGGYSEQYVPFCCHAVLEVLTCFERIPDPFVEIFSNYGGQVLKQHEKEIIDRAKGYVNEISV